MIALFILILYGKDSVRDTTSSVPNCFLANSDKEILKGENQWKYAN